MTGPSSSSSLAAAAAAAAALSHPRAEVTGDPDLARRHSVRFAHARAVAIVCALAENARARAPKYSTTSVMRMRGSWRALPSTLARHQRRTSEA